MKEERVEMKPLPGCDCNQCRDLRILLALKAGQGAPESERQEESGSERQ